MTSNNGPKTLETLEALEAENADLRHELALWRARFGADVAVVATADPDQVRSLEHSNRALRAELGAARDAASYWRRRAEPAEARPAPLEGVDR